MQQQGGKHRTSTERRSWIPYWSPQLVRSPKSPEELTTGSTWGRGTAAAATGDQILGAFLIKGKTASQRQHRWLIDDNSTLRNQLGRANRRGEAYARLTGEDWNETRPHSDEQDEGGWAAIYLAGTGAPIRAGDRQLSSIRANFPFPSCSLPLNSFVLLPSVASVL